MNPPTGRSGGRCDRRTEAKSTGRGDSYCAAPDPGRPIFQGDVFRGVPTVLVAHPAARDHVRDGIAVHGPRAMVLPHPCDFSEEEKEASHSVRLVARVVRIAQTPFAPRHVARGQIHHTVWVPDPDHDDVGPHDWLVDLRSATPVDRAFLNAERRVAALSGPAWMALMRRLVNFHTRFAISLAHLALQEAHRHPDYASL